MTFAQEQKVYFLILCNRDQIVSLQAKLGERSITCVSVFFYLFIYSVSSACYTCSKPLCLCVTGNQYSQWKVLCHELSQYWKSFTWILSHCSAIQTKPSTFKSQVFLSYINQSCCLSWYLTSLFWVSATQDEKINGKISYVAFTE